MARSSAALKAVEPAAPTFASVMEALSKNYVAQQPFKAKIKALDDEAKTLKESAITMMDDQGVKKTSTKTATISITELERTIVEDVELAYKAAKREGWLHLFEVNHTKHKEFMEKKGKPLAGTRVGISTRFIKLSGIKQV